MSEHNKDLAHEFPEFKEKIHDLKVSNGHFKKLFESYHEIAGAIYRAEQRLDVISEREEEDLRKKRLVIKDEIYSMLKSQK